MNKVTILNCEDYCEDSFQLIPEPTRKLAASVHMQLNPTAKNCGWMSGYNYMARNWRHALHHNNMC